MKPSVLFLLPLLFPALLHAQEVERHADVVILPQELNEQYQALKNSLTGSEGQARKIQETREEIKKLYPGDRNAQDLEVMLKDLDRQQHKIETNLQDWQEKMAGVEEKIKKVILSAHGRTVEWRTYNPNPVDKLGTVITTTYNLKNDHVVTVDVYDQLPVPEKR